MTEKKIPICSGYTITDDARIFSTNQKGKKEMRQHKRGHGYMCVSLTVAPYKTRNYNVHYLMAISFLGRIDSMEIRHLDGNRLNNNISNLKYGTTSENQMDRVSHGTSNRGSAHGISILTEEQVLQIRDKYVPFKYGYSKLGREYMVSASNIQAIIERKTWKHI